MDRTRMENETTPQRVRKRRRRVNVAKPVTRQRPGAPPLLLDDDVQGLDDTNHYPAIDRTAEIAVQNALPTLLFQRQERQQQLHHRTTVRAWQRRVLMTTEDDDTEKKTGTRRRHRGRWRRFAKRRVSFVDLGTPYTEALLAIDPSGSYLLTVCDEVDEGEAPSSSQQQQKGERPTAFLSIRSVPSPARLASNKLLQQQSSPSPRLLTIPLDFAPPAHVRGRLRRRKIILSLRQDWRLGLICWPATNRLRDPAAHLTVFGLPRRDDHGVAAGSYKTTRALSFPTVVQSMEGYNLLWQVECVPTVLSSPSSSSSSSCHDNCTKWTFQRQCASLCVLRVSSELRLTWFIENGTAVSEFTRGEPSAATAAATQKDAIFSTVSESIWSSALSHRLDGSLVHDSVLTQDNHRPTHHIQIAQEISLHLDRIVSAILRNRAKLARRYDEIHRLEWKCEVIDVIHEGRVLNLLMAFSPGKAKHPVAVVVSVDLFLQKFTELNWMKSTTVFSHIDMRTLCANVRMKRLECGPFASLERRSSDGHDDDDFWDAEDGSPGLHYTSPSQEYCFMPLSTLYTDTQVVSNSNILCAVPRMSMKSNSPVELVYYGDG